MPLFFAESHAHHSFGMVLTECWLFAKYSTKMNQTHFCSQELSVYWRRHRLMNSYTT